MTNSSFHRTEETSSAADISGVIECPPRSSRSLDLEGLYLGCTDYTQGYDEFLKDLEQRRRLKLCSRYEIDPNVLSRSWRERPVLGKDKLLYWFHYGVRTIPRDMSATEVERFINPFSIQSQLMDLHQLLGVLPDRHDCLPDQDLIVLGAQRRHLHTSLTETIRIEKSVDGTRLVTTMPIEGRYLRQGWPKGQSFLISRPAHY